MKGDRAAATDSAETGPAGGGPAGDSPAMLDPIEIGHRKLAAARAAAALVQDGMKVGLGTGSTVAYLLTALGERSSELGHARCAATSPATARIARDLGLKVHGLDELGELDIAIDGADQVDPGGWLVKGGGGAHTREKIVAASARRFVVIVSAEKQVTHLAPPVPLELLRFGLQRTLAALGDARLREVGASPDHNLIADYHGPFDDPRTLAQRLSETPGVVEHGLFAPEMVSEIFVAGADGVQRRAGQKSGA
jgi:ribose 5-phosphate isomerase A